MSSFFNPLRHIQEYRNYHDSFPEKLAQIYRFFAGNPNSENRNKRHLGIFDYLTLGFHPLIEYIFDGLSDALSIAADSNTHALGIILGFLIFCAGVVYVPLKLVNIAFGALATLITSPITLITHLALQPKDEGFSKKQNQSIPDSENDNSFDKVDRKALVKLHKNSYKTKTYDETVNQNDSNEMISDNDNNLELQLAIQLSKKEYHQFNW